MQAATQIRGKVTVRNQRTRKEERLVGKEKAEVQQAMSVAESEKSKNRGIKRDMKKGISNNIRQGRKGGHHVQIARPAERQAGRQT